MPAMEASKETSAEREGDPSAPTKSDEAKAAVETNPKPAEDDTKKADRAGANKKSAKNKCSKKHAKTRQKKPKKRTSASDSSSDSDSDEDDDAHGSSSSSSESDDSSSGSDEVKSKRVTKKGSESSKSRKKARSRKQRKTAKSQQSPVSDSDSESSAAVPTRRGSGGDESRHSRQALAKQLQLVQLRQLQGENSYQCDHPVINWDRYDPRAATFGDGGSGLNSMGRPQGSRAGGYQPQPGHNITHVHRNHHNHHNMDFGIIPDRKQAHKGGNKRQKANKLDYKRVDQVWDNTIHNYKLQDTAEGTVDAQYDEFLFHVRRTFDWEGKYKATVVDIKSKLLRECLRDVIGNIKGVSLVEETPKLDPNMLFLYLEDLRRYLKDLKKAKPPKGDKNERAKEEKRIALKRQQLKVLVQYIDKDYADIKNSLYPMLENGLITFELLWALWKPNTLAFTTTYGSPDEPRVFKVEMAEKHHGIMKGEYYYIEGKYFEYDGKQFGFGSMSEDIGDFRGARRITSLNCYPLKYHKNEARVRKDLIERGKKFASLGGVHYKSHQGMAYYKKKKAVIRVNINGRIMVDPSIHRRINPNYPISLVRPKDHDLISGDEGSGEEDECCGCGSEAEDGGGRAQGEEEKIKYVTKILQDGRGNVHQIRIPKADDDDDDSIKEKLDQLPNKGEDGPLCNGDESSSQHNVKDEKKVPEFTDEEYLIASPVVLGFAFAEKMWLEFTVSGVEDIQWNDSAYQSLVLEPKTKDIVKALVESHKYHAAESIDDVIQGKGKGLVAVLHGPPGTGKTLTAEGISELLKCPLYMVSAGELGTDSRYLESELQKILDICHAWGAILLLDEADVFLEKRNMHDIHRNALVSIFLRQLEYFQGILFLTTNRVETFDDAFQSRIHIALRYDNLDQRAKKAIFKIFIERVRVLEKADLMPFTEEDYNILARHELNGRQIKNTVRTAQALAVNKREPLAMSHIRQVLDVQINFERDLKGGVGYQDAMRSYF